MSQEKAVKTSRLEEARSSMHRTTEEGEVENVGKPNNKCGEPVTKRRGLYMGTNNNGIPGRGPTKADGFQ